MQAADGIVKRTFPKHKGLRGIATIAVTAEQQRGAQQEYAEQKDRDRHVTHLHHLLSWRDTIRCHACDALAKTMGAEKQTLSLVL